MCTSVEPMELHNNNKDPVTLVMTSMAFSLFPCGLGRLVKLTSVKLYTYKTFL